MGLFGPGSSYSRLGTGAEGASARKVIEDIAGPLEAELRDTPGEYFVLQAAGMLFACDVGAVRGGRMVRSMEESLAQARRIMGAFSDQPSTAVDTLESKAARVYDQLRRAAAAGAQPALVVGHLNDYLHMVENGYLERKALSGTPSLHPPGVFPSRGPLGVARSRSVFLIAMVALPLVTAAVGLAISLTNPDMKAAMARLFLGSLTVSGAGQSLFFGKRGTAILLLICGAVLILLVR